MPLIGIFISKFFFYFCKNSTCTMHMQKAFTFRICCGFPHGRPHGSLHIGRHTAVLAYTTCVYKRLLHEDQISRLAIINTLPTKICPSKIFLVSYLLGHLLDSDRSVISERVRTILKTTLVLAAVF